MKTTRVKDHQVGKFKEGTKIEVLRRIKKHFCAWFPGEIISYNGNKYTVQYQLLMNNEGEPVIEKVSQGDVRPEAPPAKEEKIWVLGDAAEVFDLNCWRVGKVVKMVKNNHFVIRLFGSIRLKEFHESSLRVRQAWLNKQWVVIKKAAGDEKTNRNNIEQSTQMEIFLNKKEHEDQVYTSSHVKTMKRIHSYDIQSSCVNDAVMQLDEDRRGTTTIVERHEQLPVNTLKQVDPIFSRKENKGNKCIIRPSEMGSQMERLNNFPIDPFPRATLVTEVSNECSVASCGTDVPNDFVTRNSWKSSRGFDDAESFCRSFPERNHLPTCNLEELDGNVHELELHAYKTTLQALHASGPLSWDQESLLTNLRLSLNISTEEHLLQLRKLLSAQIL